MTKKRMIILVWLVVVVFCGDVAIHVWHASEEQKNWYPSID